jgi:hypothetical protein
VFQKIQTLFIDDLDGSEADGTVHFGLDGTEYEIDLEYRAHSGAAHSTRARYVAAARRLPRARRAARSGRRAGTSANEDSTEIRD